MTPNRLKGKTETPSNSAIAGAGSASSILDESPLVGNYFEDDAPTPEEIASMTWQSIAGGANGFVYFRYHQLRERESKSGAKWWKDIWPGVCAAARDVKRFEQVILGESGQSVSDAPTDLAVRSWKGDGADWFLFVNATTNRLSCDVSLADASGAWKTELGLAASVKPVARGLSLDLQPLAVTLAVRR